ncbi:13907_t:CDS:2 [Gigaspora margarita]|uniref:13907_t:CDS:1 n=1 Tax=Gigaspora margarita TaxID=4874 RepID=A0ABN7V3T0_GIGMA|nr:13907_t:CDS:2 [Gigaspora margarita]
MDQLLGLNNQFEQLLEKVNQIYKSWLVLQQTNAREELLRMIQELLSHLLDPTITCTRGCPTRAESMEHITMLAIIVEPALISLVK